MAKINSDKKSILKCFHETAVHKGTYYEMRKDFTSQTYAITKYTITDSSGVVLDADTFLTASGDGSHAEVKVLQTLEEIHTNHRESGGPQIVMSAKISISFSPCSACSSLFLRFKEEQRVLSVVFANLYKIRRASCMESCKTDGLCTNHIQYDYITVDPECTLEERTEVKKGLSQRTVTPTEALENEEDSKTNTKGLKDMHEKGIVLRTFTAQDWIDLLRFLYLEDPELESQDKEMKDFLSKLESKPETVWEFLQKHLGTNTNREKEDKRMAKDLQAILESSSVEEIVAGVQQISLEKSNQVPCQGIQQQSGILQPGPPVMPLHAQQGYMPGGSPMGGSGDQSGDLRASSMPPGGTLAAMEQQRQPEQSQPLMTAPNQLGMTGSNNQSAMGNIQRGTVGHEQQDSYQQNMTFSDISQRPGGTSTYPSNSGMLSQPTSSFRGGQGSYGLSAQSHHSSDPSQGWTQQQAQIYGPYPIHQNTNMGMQMNQQMGGVGTMGLGGSSMPSPLPHTGSQPPQRPTSSQPERSCGTGNSQGQC